MEPGPSDVVQLPRYYLKSAVIAHLVQPLENASAPIIQNISKPRRAFTDIRRPGLAALLSEIADGDGSVSAKYSIIEY